jgi:hypothetical protein
MYERSVTLTKPLGLVLEELDGGAGVRIEAMQQGGSAAASGVDIAPGDHLLQVDETNVSHTDFDTIMSLLLDAPATLTLTVGDGRGRLDVTPNLARDLSPDDAVLADLVVRAAVREVRRRVGESEELSETLGELLRVEILMGAGMRPDGRCLVRFFGIFSTAGGGSSTYACNITATGRRRQGDDGIEITALSCAKDEGWGRTIDLKREAAATS